MTRPFEGDYWPTTDWRISSAEAQGMDPHQLAKLEIYARGSRPQITAVVVVRHGYIVFEEYCGFSEDRMAKLGYLYLNGGSWDGAQVIPPDDVEESTRRQSGGGPPVGRPHGYLWWIPEPHRAFFAAGLGDKLCMSFLGWIS